MCHQTAIACSVFQMLPVVRLLLVRTPPVGNPIFDGLTVCQAHLCNLPITVCIGQAAAYLKTYEANGADPSNAAVA